MTQGTATTRQKGLQQAAAIIFALVAIVPLLVFAWTLNTLHVLQRVEAQIGLALSLAVALLGFWMFRVMLGRMSEVVQAVVSAVEQTHRVRRPLAGPTSAAPTPAAHPVKATNGAASTTPAAVSPFAAGPKPERNLPGIGAIRELGEVTRTMGLLWQREANVHLGRRVQISVANSREPLIGTLSEVTDEGLILEQADEPVAIAYRRITAIEPI